MPNRKIKILCTLGPSSLTPKIINKLDRMGVDLFRINLSHTEEKEVEKTILKIRKATAKPICIDTEGAQIRNGFMAKKRVYFQEGSIVRIHRDRITGNSANLYLNPGVVLKQLQVGDLIGIDFDTVVLKVSKRKADFIETKVICAGSVGSNKAVTIDRNIKLASLTPKDLHAIKIGRRHGIEFIALSFASKKEDVENLRRLVKDKIHIISKIENRQGLNNLLSILSISDSILIDRGDLSREVSLEKIPFLQKEIIRQANRKKVPVYVATNLLESMVNTKNPTRAEINDIINTLLDGADGLVLAAETAIGAYPVACMNMIRRTIKAYELSLLNKYSINVLDNMPNTSLTLIEPHGGDLVNCLNLDSDQDELSKLPRLVVDEMALIDAEQMAIGTYSPLSGFMKKDEIHRVLKEYKLPNGTAWTLPIVLQTSKDRIKHMGRGDKIALVANKDGAVFAILDLEDIYQFDFRNIAFHWYGTENLNHPGVKMLRDRGDYFLGGRIELIRRFNNRFREFSFTPLQTRQIFEKKGWNTVVGFHTRNVIHKAHEYIQLTALKKFNIDGLFIHPIIGPKKKLDYKAEIIIKTYQLMLERYYPKDKVLLGAFSSYPRYAGPREAVFTALCRKNFGCTHFIIGRDHTGVADFYRPDEAKNLLEKIGDIGIIPIFFDEISYCRSSARYIEGTIRNNGDVLRISGSEARKILRSGKLPPKWFMRKDIAELILKEIKKEKRFFVR